MTPTFFAHYISENQEIICVLDKSETPIEFFIHRKNQLNLDEVVSGKVTSFHPSLKGYFITTNKEKQIFVPTDKPLEEGKTVNVLVTKEARLEKEATGQLTDAPISTTNLKQVVAKKYPTATQQITIDWSSLIEESLDKEITFTNGASLIIERTHACWTIDIDSGKSDLPFNKINKLALELIFKQIQLKNMSGMILVDFIGSKSFKEKQTLLKEIKPLFQSDNRTRIYDFTKMNLLELKRKTTSASLIDLFYTKKGNKTTDYLLLLIKTKLMQQKTKCCLKIHPSLLPSITNEIKSLADIVTDLNIQPNDFELKEI